MDVLPRLKRRAFYCTPAKGASVWYLNRSPVPPGSLKTNLWLANWRLFFLICSEVWDLGGGREYLVSHYLFEKRKGGC